MLSRTLRPKKNENIPLDTTSITNPCKVKKEYKIPNHIVRAFVKKYGFHLEKPVFEMSDLFLSLKIGPHGPATLSSIKTVMYLSYPILQSLFILLDETGRKWICELLKLSYSLIDKIENLFKRPHDSVRNLPVHSRLSVIKDPECKMRIIGIVDYVTQVTLSPIANRLFACLECIPMDRTFTQNPRFGHTSEKTDSSF